MAIHWTEYPQQVETFRDLSSILETLDRDNAEDCFTGESFRKESDNTAYTVDPNPNGYHFNPRLDRMPGLERLLDRFNIDGHFTLTLDQFSELRKCAANALKSNRAAVNAMTFTEAADALDAAKRPPAPPTPSNPPACRIKTFGEFLADVHAVEQAAAYTRADADAMRGEAGSGYLRMQAGVFEATAAYRDHPSFPHLEAYVNKHHGTFTYDHLLRVRGEVCTLRHCDPSEVDQLSIEEVVAALGCPGAPVANRSLSASSTRHVNTRPASVEPPRQYVDAAMRSLPSALNNAPQPRWVHDPAGRRGAGYTILRQQLEGASHSRDAVEWAIDLHIKAGRLEPAPTLTSAPWRCVDGEWGVQPVTNYTYERERCVLWANPTLWEWWRATQTPTEPSRPNQADTPMQTELPSPFTVPEPNWTLGEANIPQLENLPAVWTLGALLQQLRTFAGRYTSRHAFVEPPGTRVVLEGDLARAAIVLAYRRTLSAVPGFDELQTQILLDYESAITVSSVSRLIRDVIRATGMSMTLSQTEQLEIREALQRLNTKKKGSGPHAVKKTGGRRQIDPVFDNRVWEAWRTGSYADYAALAKELGCKKKDVEKAIDRMRKKKPQS